MSTEFALQKPMLAATTIRQFVTVQLAIPTSRNSVKSERRL
jgi:hypothetical protein